ncbi:MAG: hypothetical protein ABL897_07480 [Hyphomicrobium sp.]
MAKTSKTTTIPNDIPGVTVERLCTHTFTSAAFDREEVADIDTEKDEAKKASLISLKLIRHAENAHALLTHTTILGLNKKRTLSHPERQLLEMTKAHSELSEALAFAAKHKWPK